MAKKVHKFNSHYLSVCFGTVKEEKPMRVEKKTFILTKHFFLFSSIWTPTTFKAHNFLISFSF